MATPATLPSLPVELLHQILKHLSYGSHIALSFTCRELYIKLDTRRRLSASSTQGKAYTMDDLLEIEGWPEYNPPHPTFDVSLMNFMPCRICLNLCRRAKFCTSFQKYYYTRQNDPGYFETHVRKCRLGRVCLPCAFANGIYDHMEEDGWYMTEEGVYWHLCNRCNKLSQDLDIILGKYVCESCQDPMEA